MYKLSSGELQRKMTLESDVECVRFYDERQVVSAAAQLMMHDVETGQCALTFSDQKKGIVNAMAVEGSLVVCSHKGKKVRIWDVRSGRRVMTMATGHTHLLHDIGVVERNKHWTLPESLGTVPASPRNIAGTQDRCLVAPLITVSKDESVRLFDMRQLSVAAKPLAVLTGHKGPVRCVRMQHCHHGAESAVQLAGSWHHQSATSVARERARVHIGLLRQHHVHWSHAVDFV